MNPNLGRLRQALGISTSIVSDQEIEDNLADNVADEAGDDDAALFMIDTVLGDPGALRARLELYRQHQAMDSPEAAISHLENLRDDYAVGPPGGPEE